MHKIGMAPKAMKRMSCCLVSALWLVPSPLFSQTARDLSLEPAAGQTVVQPAGTTLAANSLNGQLYADAFLGADIGEKVNHAFLAAGQHSASDHRAVTVNLQPGQNYLFATTIHIPNEARTPYVSEPTLDCHGSTLTYKGTQGNAMLILGGYGGTIRNCFIQGNTADSLVQINGRSLFNMEHVYIQGSGKACIDQLNTTADGGPGFTENQHFRDIRLFACPAGQKMEIGPGGSNSFDYDWYTEYHLQLLPGSYGFWYAPGTEPQGTHISANANTASAGAGETTIVRVDGAFLRGFLDLHGENTGGASSFLGVAGTGYAHFEGAVQVAGLTAPMGSNFHLHAAIAPVTSQYGAENATQIIEEGDGGLGTISRQSRFDFGVQHQRAWLANYGAENDGSVSVIHCPTGKDQPVTSVPLAMCGWNIYMPATGGAGFGKGFGETIAPGKSQPGYPGHSPSYDVEAHSLGVSSTAFNASRTWTWDAEGNSLETITTSAVSGQPSKAAREVFYDSTRYKMVDGWSCFASEGLVHCSMPGDLSAGSIRTPALTPSVPIQPQGACSLPNGSLVLSLDAHATTCTNGHYVSRW